MITFDKNTDKISIIAPSSAPHADDLNKVLKGASNLLTDQGFKVKYHPEIFSKNNLNYFAAPKHVRSEALQQALDDEEVKIIWAIRGGYGASEIMSDFMPHSFQEQTLQTKYLKDKLLIGYSDITALHMLFNKHYLLPSLHAPVLNSLLGEQASMMNEIISLFERGFAEYDLTPLVSSWGKDEKNIHTTYDEIETEIIGGNLAVFCNLIGTSLHPDTKGKILIFEDIHENGYKLHRYLMHLQNAGLLKDIRAIIFGDFIGSDKDILIEESLIEFCESYLHPYNIACYRLAGFGHGKVNHPVTLGGRALLDTKASKLRISSPLRFT